MNGKLEGPDIDFAGLSPLIALLGGAVVVLLFGLLRGRAAREHGVPFLSFAALATSLGLTIWRTADRHGVAACSTTTPIPNRIP